MNEDDTVEELVKFRVRGFEFDTLDAAEAYLAEEGLRIDANKFAAEHLHREDDTQPAVRAITRLVNVIVAWEEWKSRVLVYREDG